VRLKLAFLALYCGLAMIHAYATVARYDRQEAFEDDSVNYSAMSRGQLPEQTLRLYRWRVLTPYMVQVMPFLPEALTHYYKVDEAKVLRFKWALWNGLGCIAGGLAVLALCQSLGLSLLQAGVGGLLYMTSFQVAVDGAMLLVDPWANAFMALTLALALHERLLPMALAFTLGLFCKETVILAGAWIFLLQRRGWLKQLAALVPGFLAYAYMRWVLYPGGVGRPEFDSLFAQVASFFQPLHLAYAGVEFALNFALLAPLAVFGWRASAGYPAIRRMAWLLPCLLLIPITLPVEIPRPLWTGFPVVIPLAVLGLWRVLEVGSGESGVARRGVAS
jgi:hypothetical protein